MSKAGASHSNARFEGLEYTDWRGSDRGAHDSDPTQSLAFTVVSCIALPLRTLAIAAGMTARNLGLFPRFVKSAP